MIPVRAYFRLFAGYLRPHRSKTLLLAALLLVSIALQLANPQLITRFIDGAPTMHHRVRTDGEWGEPEPVLLYPGQARALAVDMAYSPDGQRLYFLGRFSEDSEETPGFDIWVSEKRDGAWSTASVVPAPVSTEAQEFYPTVVADGSLYFPSDREGGHGESDIWRAQRQPGGSFAEPVNLGPPINTEASEGDTYVAPDESYLILSSRRPDGMGQSDLYVSFRGTDGSWGEPVSLGMGINSAETDFCPMVTPDGKYLFFSRRHGDSWANATGSDVFWVDAKILEQFRP